MLFSLRHFSLLVNFFNKDLILFPPAGWYFGSPKRPHCPPIPRDIVEKLNFLASFNKKQQDPLGLRRYNLYNTGSNAKKSKYGKLIHEQQGVVEMTVRELLSRYIDEYGWNWPFTCRLINRYCGTNYSVADLEQIYKGN